MRLTRAGLFVLMLALAVPVSFARKEERKTAEATLLDRNSYICSNCFFGTSDYYYCFDAGGKILIGYQKIPAMNWNMHDTNMLTRVRKKDAPWQPGAGRIKLSYDDKSIWVNGPDGSEIKLRQNYRTDIFIDSDRCRAAIHKTDADRTELN